MSQKLKIAIGLISLGLLGNLIYKLTSVPGGMFLSGIFLGGMWIVIILVVSLLLAWLTKLALEKLPFWTIYFTLTAIAFAIFHYQMYSPTLKIIVPENYIGEVKLIKSSETDNILTLDSNGFGYLNEWTFNKLYSRPIVVDKNGKDLTEQCVGFNPSSFSGLGTSPSSENKKMIKFLSFKIVPKDTISAQHDYDTNLPEF